MRSEPQVDERVLAPDDRYAVLRAPFVCRTYGGKTWAGCLISHGHMVPTEGGKRYSPPPEDEEVGHAWGRE